MRDLLKQDELTTTMAKYATQELHVGQEVRARFQATKFGPATTSWFPGTVDALHSDGTVDIAFDDGDREARVLPIYVRPTTSLDTS